VKCDVFSICDCFTGSKKEAMFYLENKKATRTHLRILLGSWNCSDSRSPPDKKALHAVESTGSGEDPAKIRSRVVKKSNAKNEAD
jgi:hypothetical protein